MRKGFLSGMMTAGGCGSRVLWRRMRAHHIDVSGCKTGGSGVAIAQGNADERCGHPNPPVEGSSVPIGLPGLLGDNEATNTRLLEAVISPQQHRNHQSTRDYQVVSSSNGPHHLLILWRQVSVI